MSFPYETTIHYECRECGCKWTRKFGVKVMPATIDELGTAMPDFDRPISVPQGPCCKESD